MTCPAIQRPRRGYHPAPRWFSRNVRRKLRGTLLAIIDLTLDGERLSHPTLAAIAAVADLSVKTIIRHLTELVADGWIRRFEDVPGAAWAIELTFDPRQADPPPIHSEKPRDTPPQFRIFPPPNSSVVPPPNSSAPHPLIQKGIEFREREENAPLPVLKVTDTGTKASDAADRADRLAVLRQAQEAYPETRREPERIIALIDVHGPALVGLAIEYLAECKHDPKRAYLATAFRYVKLQLEMYWQGRTAAGVADEIAMIRSKRKTTEPKPEPTPESVELARPEDIDAIYALPGMEGPAARRHRQRNEKGG